MSMRVAKAIFLIGTLSSTLLFLFLTWDTHRQIGALTHADQLSDTVVKGKRVFQKYNCNDCHTILGFGGYYAPDLTRVYLRKGKHYIAAVLERPDKVLANSFRKMPRQNLSREEIDRLVAFFAWTSAIDTHDWPPQDSDKRRRTGLRLVSAAALSAGAALFKTNDCFGCHRLGGVGGDIGPALDNVGRLPVETIRKRLTDPKTFNRDTVMPSYSNLSPQELDQLVRFLGQQHQGGSR